MKSEKRSLLEKLDIFPKIGYCSTKRTKNECFLAKSGHAIKMAISSRKTVFEKQDVRPKDRFSYKKWIFLRQKRCFKQFNQPDQFLAFTPKLVQTDFQSILCFLRNEFI